MWREVKAIAAGDANSMPYAPIGGAKEHKSSQMLFMPEIRNALFCLPIN